MATTATTGQAEAGKRPGRATSTKTADTSRKPAAREGAMPPAASSVKSSDAPRSTAAATMATARMGGPSSRPASSRGRPTAAVATRAPRSEKRARLKRG